MDSPPAKKQSSFTQNTGLHWAKTLALTPVSNTKSAGTNCKKIASSSIHHVVRKFPQPLSVHDPSIHLSTCNTNMIDSNPWWETFFCISKSMHDQSHPFVKWRDTVDSHVPPHLQPFVERRLSSCKTGPCEFNQVEDCWSK